MSLKELLLFIFLMIDCFSGSIIILKLFFSAFNIFFHLSYPYKLGTTTATTTNNDNNNNNYILISQHRRF